MSKSRASRRRVAFRKWERETFRRLPAWFSARIRSTVGNAYFTSDLCVWCQQPVLSEERSIEHIVPYSSGGDGSWENKALACIRCNGERSSQPMLMFLLQRRLGTRVWWTKAAMKNALRRGDWNVLPALAPPR